LSDQYFAARPAEELAKTLFDRLHNHRAGLYDNGQWRQWQLAYDRFYGNHFKKGKQQEGSGIVRMGDNGHLAGFAINHYRNLVKNILVLAVNQKPSFDCRAVNSDAVSTQQARLANNIMDAFHKEKKIGKYMYKAAEQSQVFRRGHVMVEWEPSAGRPYARQAVTSADGQPAVGKEGEPLTKIVYEGDVEISNPYPWQVMTDELISDWGKNKWVAVALLQNKYDLAARHPEIAERILAIPSIAEKERERWFNFGGRRISPETSGAMIEVIKFFHLRTDYMQSGRYLLALSDGITAYDGPIPYDALPVFRIVPGEMIDSTDGYTDFDDIIGAQDAYNTVISIIFSNIQALGLNIIATPEGSNISKDMIAKGLVFMKVPPGGEPKAINLSPVPDTLFKLLELIERSMETTSGVNSVVRGNPEYNMSGVAMSLLQSLTLQFASLFQQSWVDLYEDAGTFIVKLLSTFAKTERMVAMAGKMNKHAMQSFKGDDLKNVQRVILEVGNPLSRTTSGKLHIADTLLDKGLISTPQEYITAMTAGTIEPLYQGKQSQLDRIHAENEALMDGEPVSALVSDPHLLDIQEHTIVINDPYIRKAAQQGDQKASAIVANALNHIDQHMQLYKTQDPLWSQVAGEPPAPPQMMPPEMPMPPPAGGEAQPMGPVDPVEKLGDKAMGGNPNNLNAPNPAGVAPSALGLV
jgi:hypothetical protein